MATGASDSFCLCSKSKPDLLWEPGPTWVSAESNDLIMLGYYWGSEMHKHNVWLLDRSWFSSDQWEYRHFQLASVSICWVYVVLRKLELEKEPKEHAFFLLLKEIFQACPYQLHATQFFSHSYRECHSLQLTASVAFCFPFFYNLMHIPAPFS